MIRRSIFLAFILWSLAATVYAQPKNGILQSGLITPGHAPMWVTTGIVGDAGSSLSGNLTEVGITNTGTPFCINDAPTTGKYHQFCLGANSLGGGLISYQALGGATPLPLQFNINGVTAQLPAASGNPGTALIVDQKLFSSPGPATMQPVALWPTCVHQNQGCGNDFNHAWVWRDQSSSILGDHLNLQTDDGSLLTFVKASGTPTNGETVSLTWTIPGAVGSPFIIPYTMTGGDTTHTIALNLCIAMVGNVNLMSALAAYRYSGQVGNWGYAPLQAGNNSTGCAAQTPGSQISMDIPWGTTLSATSSAHVTIAAGGLQGGSPKLDGSPYIQIARFVPGYIPQANDLGPALDISGQKGSSSTIPDKVLFDLQSLYTGANSTSGYFTTSGTGNSGLEPYDGSEPAGGVNQRFQIGDGAYVWGGGAQACFGDLGVGSMSACELIGQTYWSGTAGGSSRVIDPAPTIFKDAGGNTIFQSQSGKEATLTVSGSTTGLGVTAGSILLGEPTAMGAAMAFSLAPLTLASLLANTCNSGSNGQKFLVTDINTGTPTFHAAASTYTGGGSIELPFTCEGNSGTWRSM